ncbi:MAG: drug/metabolite exporter YedA [Gemmatimonadetes bacterium]|nr:drug/metabolite exporter YedA [Gemmatimonadota bacterium]
MNLQSTPRRGSVVAGFTAVYLVWGSTYLAIRYAIETLPPLMMAGTRFLVAGTILYAWVRLRRGQRPDRGHWLPATVVGGLLLLGGNGALSWSEQRVPSGLAALIVASVPIWMVLLDALAPHGARPRRGVIAGLVLGFGGLVMLVGPGRLAGGGRVDLIGAGVLLTGSISWALGSLYSRSARLPTSPLLATAMEMLAGGVLLLSVGALTGEAWRVDLSAVSPRSILALGYLVAFGSLVGFTTYIWLLRVSTPARVSTYAYVNPLVALFLGWALAGEALTGRTLIAAATILGAVALITTSGMRMPALEREHPAPIEPT